MANGETSQSGLGSRTNKPITDSDSARDTGDGRTLISFESFENSDMLPDCRGWLIESRTGERFWCVAASKTLGLFDGPEGEEPMMVLTLTDFQIAELIKDLDNTENCDCDKCGSSNSGISWNCPIRRKEYILELKPILEGERHYSFIVPTEEEFLPWSRTLLAGTKEASFSQRMNGQKKKCSQMDSGLGEDLESSPLAQSKESDLPADVSKLPQQESMESDTTSRDGEWESRTDYVQSRGSSFLSMNDDLADLSDSASGDNNSTVNLSDSETYSYGRQSLNDSVFLGASQEWDPSLWNESKDADSFVSDGDSAPVSPRPHSPSSMNSAGNITKGPHSDQNKTVISKVSKLVQRVGLMRRPRVTSGLTLGHLPDQRMSGLMRKKGKTCWYVLSGSCLYCFKTNSPEAKTETIYDLSSHSVAMATEEKEDGQSMGMLKLTHSSGKKVMFAINSIDTARLWFSYIEDAIRLAVATSVSRSDSQKSTSSNPDAQSSRQGSMSSRLSRESFEESYGYFERQSSLRAERDAVHNAITEEARTGKQDSSSGSSATADEKQESRSLSDFESVAPSASTWQSSDDLDLAEKETNPALRFVKRSVRSSLPSKQNARQMPIPASDVIDPTLSGYLHVYVRSKGAWKKSWAVLKDDWLYFYKKPTDTSTADVIDLSNHTIKRERMLGDDTLLAKQKFMFSISHKNGSTRAVLMGESENKTRAWMDKMKCRALHQSTMLEGLNLESGPSSHQLLTPESSEKCHTDQAELHKQKLLMEVLQQNQLANSGPQGALDSPESPLELEDPELAKKKAEILTKYQKANDEEEEDLVRLMTILNRRRMSAQVKKDDLQKTIRNKAKKRVERIGSVEESVMEDQIRILNKRLGSINGEINAKSMQKTNRLQALKEKEDLELQLLEQQERLSRYRRLAQDALQGTVDYQGILSGLAEENLEDATGSSEDGLDSSSRESLKEQSVTGADETGSSSNVPETQTETIKQRMSPALHRKAADKSPPKSPNFYTRRQLPTLPNKRQKPLRVSQVFDSQNRMGDIVKDDKSLQGAGQRSTNADGPLVKKSSPLARLRKISIGAKTTLDITQPTKETRNRKLTPGMKSSASFDEGLGKIMGDPKPSLKQSVSITDLSTSAKGSPTPRRAMVGDPLQVGSPSPQRHRRKISVPIRMPSMENLFPSSSKSNKEKTRKKSTINAPSLDNGAVPQPLSRVEAIHYTGQANTELSPNSSPDVNGNVPSAGKGQEERSQGKRRAVRDEIDPEVLRDIEEFEMMARKALQEAGWIFRS